MDKFAYYTFVKGLQGLTREKKIKILVELTRRFKILS